MTPTLTLYSLFYPTKSCDKMSWYTRDDQVCSRPPSGGRVNYLPTVRTPEIKE